MRSKNRTGDPAETQSVTNYTYNNLNQMLTAGNISFTYDANGNTVSKQANQQTTTYTWDYEDKLTRIDYPNGSNNTFTTNADGQRMTANDTGGQRRFLYDGITLMAEQDMGSGNLLAAYDHGVGGLARQMRGTGASYYQWDGLGSTRQLTDANQAVTDAVSYDGWGNVLSSSGATTNAFKYVGRLGYYDNSDSGLMLLGVRYYSSGVGRFWTGDPIMDEANWYLYAHNNPVIFVDATGYKTGTIAPPGPPVTVSPPSQPSLLCRIIGGIGQGLKGCARFGGTLLCVLTIQDPAGEPYRELPGDTTWTNKQCLDACAALYKKGSKEYNECIAVCKGFKGPKTCHRLRLYCEHLSRHRGAYDICMQIWRRLCTLAN